MITLCHYNDVIMSLFASQITSLTIVYSTVYSDADQRKHQSAAPLAFVRGIHRGPVNSPHKGPATRKMFPFDDVIMLCVVNKRPISQIPECTYSIYHNAPFKTEMCTFLFWMEHCGIWNRRILGFVNSVDWKFFNKGDSMVISADVTLVILFLT